MNTDFNHIQKCSGQMVTAVSVTKITDNRIKAVLCKSKTMNVFSVIRIDITKFKTTYDPVADGAIKWMVIADDGTTFSFERNSPYLDFYALENICYKKVKIYPYLYRMNPKLFVELTIENNLSINSRASWDARPPITNNPKLSYEKVEDLTSYDSIVIHHGGNEHDYPTMKDVQNLHMDASDKYKRADIGYHFGIDRDGKIYEGRNIAIKGSHVDKGNTGKIGIILLADLSTDNEGLKWYKRLGENSNGELKEPMINSLLKLCVHLDHLYGITTLGGHNEFSAKSGETRYCPGNLAIDKMNDWRTKLNKQKP